MGKVWELLPASFPGLLRFVLTGAAVALGIAGLVAGQPVLMPLAFAALLAFVLEPMVSLLRRFRLPQGLAVGLVVALTLAVLAVATLVLVQQALALSRDLPRHQATIQKKVRELVPALGGGGGGAVAGASKVLDVVERELNAAREALPGAKAEARPPSRVVLEPTPVPPLRALADLVTPFLVPLANAGLVFLLLAFMLLQRRELRDRLVRLTGGDLHLMADALSESGRRVSRFLIAQVLVNVGYGVPMAIGLWWIGVPGALLWGTLAAVMRFIPYLGPAIAAIFPVVIAFAVDPGWDMVLWTVGLILVLELISNNVVEPLAYGGSTGVSPVAVVVSASFWALVWGPVGLMLATPLTVVLVVMGRHLHPLRFMDLLLGSAPVFDTATQLYQRLISGDRQESADLAQQQIAAHGLAAFYSETAVPTLGLAAESSSKQITAAHRHRLLVGAAAMLESLQGGVADEPPGSPPPSVLCIGCRTEYDTLSAEMLAHALRDAGTAAHALPPLALNADRIGTLPLQGVRAVALCTFNSAPQTHTRFVVRRLRRRQPALPVVLAAWAAPSELRIPGGVAPLGVSALAVTLSEAVGRLQADVAATAAQGPAPVAAGAGTAAAAPGSAGDEAAEAAPAVHVPSLDAGGLQGLQDVLARHAQRSAEVFGVPLATVLVRTADAGVMQVSAGAASWTQRDSEAVVTAGSPLDAVLTTGRPLVLSDVTREPRFVGRQDLRFDGLDFFAGQPLRPDGSGVVGTLALHDARARDFSDAEQALLAQMTIELERALGLAGFQLQPGPGPSAPPAPALPAAADAAATSAG